MKNRLPNVRKLFIPDEGHIIVEADLVGADAMTAAMEIGGRFRDDFFSGKMKHTETMQLCYPIVWSERKERYLAKMDSKILEPEYTKCKNMVYGALYVGSARGIASSAGIPEPIVKKFQLWFFARYPEVKEWHRRIEFELQTTREVSNAFGYRVHYFDRPDGLLPEAVNWKCQSTTSIVCQKGKVILFREFPNVQLLLDVHDSLVFQIAESLARQLLAIRVRLDSIAVPYPTPLYIPWAFKWSRESWGVAAPIQWETFANAA